MGDRKDSRPVKNLALARRSLENVVWLNKSQKVVVVVVVK